YHLKYGANIFSIRSGYFQNQSKADLFVTLKTGANQIATRRAKGVLTPNDWHLVSVVYNGDIGTSPNFEERLEIRIDGQLVGSIPFDGANAVPLPSQLLTPTTSTILSIGDAVTAPNGQKTTIKGFMDEVEIFNRALGENEIKAIYNAGSIGKCTGNSGGAAQLRVGGRNIISLADTFESVRVKLDTSGVQLGDVQKYFPSAISNISVYRQLFGVKSTGQSFGGPEYDAWKKMVEYLIDTESKYPGESYYVHFKNNDTFYKFDFNKKIFTTIAKKDKLRSLSYDGSFNVLHANENNYEEPLYTPDTWHGQPCIIPCELVEDVKM
ncbi:MAG: hypothetical protein US50_C0069G0001, partial [Candidatus Nomurabacteria bacterium GW2011_GWB1_37_5]